MTTPIKGQGTCFPQEEKRKNVGQTKTTGVYNECLLCVRHIQFEKNLKGYLIMIAFKNTRVNVFAEGLLPTGKETLLVLSPGHSLAGQSQLQQPLPVPYCLELALNIGAHLTCLQGINQPSPTALR